METSKHSPIIFVSSFQRSAFLSLYGHSRVGKFMGLMHNLPILLVKDKDINSGVFDAKLSEYFVATITVDYDSRELRYNPAMKRWLAAF